MEGDGQGRDRGPHRVVSSGGWPSRREVLFGLLGALLGGPLLASGAPPFGRRQAPENARLAARFLRRRLEAREATGTTLVMEPWLRARPLGEAYLAGFPSEARRDVLETRIRQRLPHRATRRGPTRATLQRVIEADFAAGDTVRLHGWILSRTECRLSALAALHS